MAQQARPRQRQKRGDVTTARLIEVARTLFAQQGYAATSLEAVVAECGVTKGALYHHFTSKRALFEAVFQDEERRLCDEVTAAYAKTRDPWGGLYAGCRAFLRVMLDPGTQRITLMEAPSVLGWDRVHDIRADYGLSLLRSGLRAAAKSGRLARRDVDPLAHLLFGALCEGATMVARADDQPAATRKVERELKTLLDALAT